MATVAASISKALARKPRRRGPSNLATENWDPYLPLPSFYFSTSAPAISPVPQPSSTSAQCQDKQRSIWSKMFLFLPGAITFGLGTWQIFRRQEKIKMLEYRQNRLGMEPIKCDSIDPSSESVDSLEFRRMVCKGVFDEKKSIYVGPRSRSISGVTENGYYTITPLMPIPGNPVSVQVPVLVNRGWVPRSWRDKSLENAQCAEQPVNMASTSARESARKSWWKLWFKEPNKVKDVIPAVIPTEVVGVVRGSEKPSIFVPANDPSSSQWFYIDVPAIAHFCGLPENTIYIEDINENVSPRNPYPIPKDAMTLMRSSVMPQDHLNYMLTWYSLSAAVTYMAFKRLNPTKSRR